MKQKKIVMIGNTAWGMYKFRSDTMLSLIKSGHQIVVIAPFDEWAKKLELLGCEFLDVPVERKGVNPLKDILYLYRLTQKILDTKPEIVISYTIKPVLYGTIAAWLAGVTQRIAITTGLGYTFSKKNWVSSVSKILHRIALKFATQVWFLNNEDLSTFLNSKLVSTNKTFVLPGEGVDISAYSPFKKQSTGMVFTLISRMLWDKGVGIFAECAGEIKKTHPQFKFYIAGPVDIGNPESIPASKLEEWNIQGHVTYLGSLDDIRSLLMETSCLVHPTYYKEGLPRILMEANAMGIPCITTEIAGCKDVVIDGFNGYLIEPKNKSQLKDAMLKFASLNEKELELFHLRSRQRMVELFSSTIISEIYAKKLSL